MQSFVECKVSLADGTLAFLLRQRRLRSQRRVLRCERLHRTGHPARWSWRLPSCENGSPSPSTSRSEHGKVSTIRKKKIHCKESTVQKYICKRSVPSFSLFLDSFYKKKNGLTTCLGRHLVLLCSWNQIVILSISCRRNTNTATTWCCTTFSITFTEPEVIQSLWS